MINIGKLSVDYKINPLGIDNESPALSWQFYANRRGEYQTAYQVLVADSKEVLERDQGNQWDSGKVESQEAQHVIYSGKKLQSRVRYYWKIKVWDRDGKESKWSKVSFWEMGLLSSDDWKAKWITAPFLKKPNPEPDLLRGVPVIWDNTQQSDDEIKSTKRYFRFTFNLDQLPDDAKLQVFAADSLYIHINEHDEGLYFPYLQTVSLDIKHLLHSGKNILACSTDGEKQGFIALLSISNSDGSTTNYSTEKGWKVFNYPEDGWTTADMKDEHWRVPIQIGEFGKDDWSDYKHILYPVNTAYGPCPKFNKQLQISQPIAKARLYVSALGIYQSYLNGKKISNDVFTPGWTDYHKRIPYQTYDITHMFNTGDNNFETVVGPGWYAGNLAICGPYHYGSKVACRAQIHIQYENGVTETIYTDDSWRAAKSPILSTDIYMGEVYDARKEARSDWVRSINLDQVPKGKMKAQQGPPIQETNRITPQSIKKIGKSTHVVDMGQNMVGWVKLSVEGSESTKVTLRYAEKLSSDGRIYRDNLRTAKQTDTYILKGEGKEIFEPHFTFHGFQYVEIEGFHGELTPDKIVGIVVNSAAEEVSEIHTSNHLINRLMDNIKWSQRGNFFGIPLDCPQRDERLGWTGDAHAFARTATYNMNCADFYTKWLTDIRDAQGVEGAYPDIAPFVNHFGRGHVFFADGGVILPWTLYKVYGDQRFIEQNYESMQRWIEWMIRDSDKNLVRRTESFGDHLSYGAETPKSLINAAFFAYSVKLMVQMSKVIGKSNDSDRYENLFGKLKKSFQKRFISKEGKIKSGTQTAYVLTLMIDLIPDDMKQVALQRLIDDIRNRGWHLTTGFMGVGYVLPLLSEYGETEAAYRLLLQEEFPSWLYSVKQGATTIWERWDGWTEEKGFQDPEMNSFNHYALGSVGEWIYRYLIGIDLDENTAGFQSFRIQPHPGGGIEFARCRYQSLYGWIESSWEMKDDCFNLQIQVPANSTAKVRIPAQLNSEIWIDGKRMENNKIDDENLPCSFIKRDDQAVFMQVGSGRYEFKVQDTIKNNYDSKRKLVKDNL